MKQLKFSIAIPTYNGSEWIVETLESILSQGFQNYEIVISDDCSTDDTLDVIKSFDEPRIKIFQNKENLGYGKNLKTLKNRISGDVLFLMGQDDLLLKGALEKTHSAFFLEDNIGVVTRPYYWFDDDPGTPVRAVRPYSKELDSVMSVQDGREEVQKIFESVGQLSGLAYRVEYMERNFHEHCFPSHIYPFAEITKRHKVAFLKDYTVAVRIASSQTRFKSSIYDISPTKTWVKMFETVYAGNEYENVRDWGIEQVATNFVGLVQLKNYSTFKNLIREIAFLVKIRPQNLLNFKFWFFSLGVIVMPRSFLIPMVDMYKNTINSCTLTDIEINL
ncbi:MAG: glycosyltransferase [Patescibacteria group bacterium]|nr:glycosyltransferase [Patescibacteria group bacterium]